jgi:peptide-methionine (S)-S-oxide reductase
MGLFGRRNTEMVDPAAALPGRGQEMSVPTRHAVLDAPLKGPFPAGIETAVFGMGCFWGAERIFWEAACSGRTGHAEVVLVAFDAAATSYQDMLKLFWEGHDPTQGMRQGNDVGSQYRSLILYNGEAQRSAAEASLSAYQQVLSAAGHGTITTELAELDGAHPFYYAEDYHQQYLAKNPGGYCGIGGTGVACPVGVAG